MKYPFLHIIVFIISSIIWSCSSNNDATLNIVEQWQGRIIEFPSVMVDAVTGDTIDISSADFTILTYIDSTGCTGCRMKLPIWRSFINSLDSLPGDAEVNTIIVINARDEEELKYLIKHNAYAFPIVNDRNDSLNTLNVFPNKSKFRSFILDHNHRVIAMGNPVNNSAIADLYRAIISGRKTISDSGNQMIETDCSSISIGAISSGEKREIDFILKNQSIDSVYIRDIITSCHCTWVSSIDSILLPNSSTSLKVFIKEDSIIGDFNRTIHIFYKNFTNPTILEITGSVIY